MKKMPSLTLIFVILCLCPACKTPQYLPAEAVKTEQRYAYAHDSIFRYDSIFLKQQGDIRGYSYTAEIVTYCLT